MQMIDEKNQETKRKLKAVQHLVSVFGEKNDFGGEIVVTEDNYFHTFSDIYILMIFTFGSHKGVDGVKVTNHRFDQFIHFEFLPQYAKIIGFDLKGFQNYGKDIMQGNLFL